jgi:O-succinylbenzoate synthase
MTMATVAELTAHLTALNAPYETLAEHKDHPKVAAHHAAAHAVFREIAKKQIQARLAAVTAGKPDPLPEMLEQMRAQALAE